MKEEVKTQKEAKDNGWEPSLNEWQREQFIGLSDRAVAVLKRYPSLQTTFFGGQWTEVSGEDYSYKGILNRIYEFLVEEEGEEKARAVKAELLTHRKKKMKI